MRNHQVDLWRFIFSIIIMLHHSRYVFGDDNCIFLGGSFSVEFFFLVSGFLFAMQAEKDRTRQPLQPGELGPRTMGFVWRRAKGFLPEHLISWTIGFAVMVAAGHMGLFKAWETFRNAFCELTLIKMTGIFRSGFNGVTWYLSSMLICIAILYPLLQKWPEWTETWICPVVSLLVLGLLIQVDGHPRNPTKWFYVTYKGNLRALGEMSLGIAMYAAVREIRRRHTFSGKERVLISLVSWWILLSSFGYMYHEKPGKGDAFWLVMFFAAVMGLFLSGNGFLEGVYSGKWGAFFTKGTNLLAIYSQALFLSHIYIASHLKAFVPEGSVSWNGRLMIYVVLSLANGALVAALSAFVRRRARRPFCL